MRSYQINHLQYKGGCFLKDQIVSVQYRDVNVFCAVTVPVIVVASTFCARDFRSPCPLRPMVTGQHRYLHSRFQRCKCKDNPCPCIYCPYTTNTPPSHEYSMNDSMSWSWVLLFWHCYFKWTSLPVLLELVKEIALYITVWRCGLKAIYWSGCFDLTWSWSHDTHSFHCCTFSSFVRARFHDGQMARSFWAPFENIEFSFNLKRNQFYPCQ